MAFGEINELIGIWFGSIVVVCLSHYQWNDNEHFVNVYFVCFFAEYVEGEGNDDVTKSIDDDDLAGLYSTSELRNAVIGVISVGEMLSFLFVIAFSFSMFT